MNYLIFEEDIHQEDFKGEKVLLTDCDEISDKINKKNIIKVFNEIIETAQKNA